MKFKEIKTEFFFVIFKVHQRNYLRMVYSVLLLKIVKVSLMMCYSGDAAYDENKIAFNIVTTIEVNADSCDNKKLTVHVR